MARFYLMPFVSVTVAGSRSMLAPKYYGEIDAAGGSLTSVSWSGACLVRVEGPTSLHTTLVAHPDCLAAPEDLSDQVGASLVAVQTRLESLGIPADWIIATTPFREILRGVHRIALVLQRLTGLAVNLSTTWTNLPQAVKDRLTAAAVRWEMDTSSLSGNSTVRQILRALSVQYPRLTIMGGDSL